MALKKKRGSGFQVDKKPKLERAVGMGRQFNLKWFPFPKGSIPLPKNRRFDGRKIPIPTNRINMG